MNFSGYRSFVQEYMTPYELIDLPGVYGSLISVHSQILILVIIFITKVLLIIEFASKCWTITGLTGLHILMNSCVRLPLPDQLTIVFNQDKFHDENLDDKSTPTTQIERYIYNKRFLQVRECKSH